MTETRTPSAASARITQIVTLLWLPVALVVAVFLLSMGSTNIYFPPATVVVGTIADGFGGGELGSALRYSLTNFACGFVIAGVVGIAGGLFLGERPSVRSAFEPLLNFVRSLPFVALVPIFIVALGITAAPKIALIALGCLWPVLLNTTDGVRAIAPAIRETSRSYRIGSALRLRRVTVMASLPQIFAGLRIALSVGIVLVVVSEMYGSTEGIGYYILFSAQRFAIAETWAGTFVLAAVGYLLNVIFVWIEHLTLGWYHRRAPRTRTSQKALA
jgi:ABC-type nitrate/sulfonate/bicarbonate transport system permease component